ncbi:MAG: DUF1156 domain-containing protein [Acidobacteria bacterium]|nr:DUF1156 domain-containing protein [Acidobacteriota bacterium]
MDDYPRLIENAFPLKETSIDSVHEKNVRHGHISTLHIWPARRPLAACRAALIATLLPDPGDPEKRRELCGKIGGRIKKVVERKKMPNGAVIEREKEVTEGGILHWHGDPKSKDERDIAKKQKEDIEWFREEIRRAYGGRSPRVLDPFAGGGAIPLEAMRLGCEVTACDINPVAWFILKCTLDYPQKLAGQTWPLPEFILSNEEFIRTFLEKAKGMGASEAKIAFEALQTGAAHVQRKGAKTRRRKGAHDMESAVNGVLFPAERMDAEADLAWQVRAWGQWVLERARRDLARYYPIYAELQPIEPGQPYEPQPPRLVPIREDGTADVDALNANHSAEYLARRRNPRWVAKPAVAYLWARTVKCKSCRATLPLLKTRWLARKDRKRVVLTMSPRADGTGVNFGVDAEVLVKGGNAAQRREGDRKIGAGTMSRSGAKCPCCSAIMTMEDIRVEGQAGRLGSIMTAVVVDGPKGKEYRLPTDHEREVARVTKEDLQTAFADVPFGIPNEPMPSSEALGMRVQLYGFDVWHKLFTPRQLLALGTFVKHTRAAREAMAKYHYTSVWIESVFAYLSAAVSRLADRESELCTWQVNAEQINHTFARFALPITWDFVELMPLADSSGGYLQAVEWVGLVGWHLLDAAVEAPPPLVKCRSALQPDRNGAFDAIITDPPYYDAIPYSDLMDFFYIWLRRIQDGQPASADEFEPVLGPKWSSERQDGELIDDPSRHDSDSERSKAAYEIGMARSFSACGSILAENGRMVVVFANKQPDAWETLVAALIRAGFCVDGSWPIQTERSARVRSLTSAALASSVWLVCKKRPAASQPGWHTKVLAEMRENIGQRLREFWDAGIRGPDFVWAATGPALEAYSKHPAVKKTTDPGKLMTVTEFLTHVRRIVVDYIVGQVLSGGSRGDEDTAAAERLDEPTAYYLLHRYDFGFEDAPIGAVILYAVSCGLSDRELSDTWDLIAKTGSDASVDDSHERDDIEDEAEESEERSGGRARLKTWSQRHGKSMGVEAPKGRAIPLIDRLHRLLHLWRAGDVHKVDAYLDDHGLRRQELFKRVLQSLIELSRHDKRPDKEELQMLESLSNHIGAKGPVPVSRYYDEITNDD